MPISQKIKDQIKKTKATKREKELMLELLEIEDQGTYRYEAEYEKKIRNFIQSSEQSKGGK